MRQVTYITLLILARVVLLVGIGEFAHAGARQDIRFLELDAIPDERVKARIEWLEKQTAPWRSELPMDPVALEQLVKHQVQLAILGDLARLEQRRAHLQSSITEQADRIKDIKSAGGTRKQLETLQAQLEEAKEDLRRTERLYLCSGKDFEANKRNGTLVGLEDARVSVAPSFGRYLALLFREVDASEGRRNKTRKTDLERLAEAFEKSQAHFAFDATRDDGRRKALQNLALRQYYERCAATCREATQLAGRGDISALNRLLERARAAWLADLLEAPPAAGASGAIEAGSDRGASDVAQQVGDDVATTARSRGEVPPLTTLDIGMDAPALQVSGWVNGGPHSELRQGTIYVVHLFNSEFAVGLERSQMVPLLDKLQRAYASAGVVVLAISCADKAPDSVFKFVADQKGKVSYAVARDFRKEWATQTDSDPGFMVEHWIQPSTAKDERGKRIGSIGPYPLTFVVDAQGQVAYVGKPNGLERVIASLLTRSWDENEARFARRFEVTRGGFLKTALREASYSRDRADETWYEAITAALSCDWGRAVDTCIKFRGESVTSGSHLARPELVALNRSIVELLSIANRPLEARALAKQVVDGAASTNAGELTWIAQVLLDEKTHRPEAADVELALTALDRARQLTADSDPWALSLVALARFLNGDKPAAVQIQEQALTRLREAGAGETSKEFKDFLAAQEAQLRRFRE
ncbi:MAG: hypothetical protein IT459_03750 [Planctomycetes bacterium]|nr:hypothetical protein [Planctomycetota bacterium]